MASDTKRIKILLIAALLGFGFLFTGCSNDSELEDAVEETGDAVKEAAETAEDAAEEAADEVKDATN